MCFDVSYADHGTTLVLKADLERGWRKLHQTYGFSGQKRIRYKGDWNIRNQIALIVHPSTFDERAAKFPEASLEVTDAFLGISLSTGHLTTRVALREDQDWRIMATGHPGLFVEKLPLFRTPNRLSYYLRLWIVFHEPPPAPPPDVRVWAQRLFVPGGQFESNRQRH